MKKLLIVALMAIALSGCGLSDIKPTDKWSLTANAWWSTTKISFGDDDMTDSSIDKMNSYIDVRNYVDPALNDSINAYIDRAGNDWDLTGTSKITKNWWLVNMSGDDYITKAQASLKAEPKIKFDPLAEKYISIFAKLHTKNNELYKYYNTQEYKKDNFTKWKALHKDFIDLINVYDNSYPDFIANYDEWFLALQLDNMRYYKSNGQTAKYSVESISLYKKYLMNEVDALDKKINKNQTIDPAEFNKYLAKFDEAVKYINDQKDEEVIKKDLWDNNLETFNAIKKTANDMLVSAKELDPLLNKFDKINLEKINSIIDKLYNLEETIIWLRNKTIN